MNKKDQELNLKNNEDEVIEDDITLEADEENRQENSFGGDIKKLREKLKKTTEEKQEYLAGWQRAKADLINSKRDFDEQKKDFVKFAKGDLIVQIIPVLDSFDMAFKNTDGVPEQWLKGVEYIYNQFVSVLEENGVKQINPKSGEDFDINKHNSVEVEKVENKNDSGKIFSVIQKGYSLNDKVLREAKVKVGEYNK
jgi:molecular chaperone GrpE